MLYEVITRVGLFGGFDDRLARRVRTTVGDVVGDGVVEQERLLVDEGDMLAQAGEGDLAQVSYNFV